MSVKDSISLIQEEIEILNPDVIISAINNVETVKKIFPDFKVEIFKGEEDWDTFSVNILGRKIRFVNNYHFSTRTSDKNIYDIVRDSFKKHTFDSFII